MPLPEDAKVVETSKDIVELFHSIFGPHPDYRPAHAKGLLLKGTLTPTETAKKLSKAPHFKKDSTPVIARFSNSTGLPQIPDNDANANPRGFAVRFMLAETPRRVHTDIITHSTPFFPARTPEDTFKFFKTLKDGTTPQWLETHPEAVAFIRAPKPAPSSFARENFFSVNAFKLIAEDGKETFIRYKILPEAGEDHLDAAAVKEKLENYLFEELPGSLKQGPIAFKLKAQVAKDGDVTDDVSVHWPEDREVVDLGTIKLESLVDNNATEQQKIIFDPVPRVDGVEASDDPLINLRAGIYLISGRERRAAQLSD